MDGHCTALIVDDSAEDRAIYRRFLQRDNHFYYQILESDSGFEALKLCQQVRPDIILLDFGLPDTDGLEFLNLLKLQSGLPQVPVVMLTGQGNEVIAVQAMKSGAQDYLVKSNLTATILCRTLHRVMERLHLVQQLEKSREQQRLIGEIALRIRQSLRLEDVLNGVVTEVRQFLKADRVIVFQFASTVSGRIMAESALPKWTSMLNLQIADTFFQEHSSLDFLQGRKHAIANIDQTNLPTSYLKLLEQFQIKANLVVPILLNGGTGIKDPTGFYSASPSLPSAFLWGLLIVHQCSQPRDWQPSELDLLDQLAGQIAIAIQHASALEKAQTELVERQRIEARLQQLNQELEMRVQQRTQELEYSQAILRQREQETLKALEKERELSELKSRFVSMISHEFRTPLTTIQSATELLEYYSWSEEEKQERFQQIYTAVQHMTQLLEDVLLIGKAEAGKLSLKPELFDLSEFCQNLVSNLLTVSSQHQILLTIVGQPKQVYLDPKLIRQILNNLLLNAIKYTPMSSSIQLRLEYQAAWVVLQVIDDGIGIPDSDQKHIFEAFYRAINAETIQGTGLGLAIVKRCVDLHRGQISLKSTVNVGTTFTVILPLKAATDL